MGAAYMCRICGIENATIDNSAAYLQGWLKKLKSDKKFIVSASRLAQKAVDYILENQKPTSVAKPAPVKRKRRKKVKPMVLAF